MTATVDALRYPEDGACYQSDDRGFFPSTEDPGHPAVVAMKQRFCDRCPVRQACLDDALAKQSDWGIFGGTTGEERRLLRRSMARRPKFTPTGTKKRKS
jgi:WhiB family transcriptional regulator, redox-sensing transcriptional regulator